MLAAALIVTRLLGLISGEQPVDVTVDPTVHSVSIVEDGATKATLNAAPWRAVVDFGPELAPHDLTVLAYDAEGKEIARDRQLVNLPRPAAEAFIDLDRRGERMRATVRWQHIGGADPNRIVTRLDGRTLSIERPTVTLPRVDMTTVHVLEAEVGFPANVVARKELVFGGVYTDEEPAELTGVLVKRTGEGNVDASSCLRLDGNIVPVRASEEGRALLMVVRDASPTKARRTLTLPHLRQVDTERDFTLPGVEMRLIFPTAERQRAEPGEPAASLFGKSATYDGAKGLWWLLTRVSGRVEWTPRRVADATAVAGVQALANTRPRAVVVVLDDESDASHYRGDAVRRYLGRIGVPLYVWSLSGITPAMKDEWGDVRDVSNYPRLREATDELRRELLRQTIVWVRADPIDALRITASGCALETVARP